MLDGVPLPSFNPGACYPFGALTRPCRANEAGNLRYIMDLIGKVTRVAMETNRIVRGSEGQGVRQVCALFPRHCFCDKKISELGVVEAAVHRGTTPHEASVECVRRFEHFVQIRKLKVPINDRSQYAETEIEAQDTLPAIRDVVINCPEPIWAFKVVCILDKRGVDPHGRKSMWISLISCRFTGGNE